MTSPPPMMLAAIPVFRRAKAELRTALRGMRTPVGEDLRCITATYHNALGVGGDTHRVGDTHRWGYWGHVLYQGQQRGSVQGGYWGHPPPRNTRLVAGWGHPPHRVSDTHRQGGHWGHPPSVGAPDWGHPPSVGGVVGSPTGLAGVGDTHRGGVIGDTHPFGDTHRRVGDWSGQLGTPTAKGRCRDTQDRVGRRVGTVGDTHHSFARSVRDAHHRFATGERRTNCSLSAKRRLRSSRGRCPEWIARTHPLQGRPSRP